MEGTNTKRVCKLENQNTISNSLAFTSRSKQISISNFHTDEIRDSTIVISTENNKKVLLRERKRHTARRISSARYARGGGRGLVRGPGGVPGVGGGPHPRSGGGYPVPGLGGTPLSRPGMGYPPGQTWDGIHPPPASVDRHTDWCQNITFPRTTYAGGNQLTSPYDRKSDPQLSEIVLRKALTADNFQSPDSLCLILAPLEYTHREIPSSKIKIKTTFNAGVHHNVYFTNLFNTAAVSNMVFV